MNATQLSKDLDAIDKTINRSTVDEPIKRLLTEITEWNRALVAQVGTGAGGDSPALDERITALEAEVYELIHGAEEGISTETAQVLLAGYAKSQLLCATVLAFLRSEENTLDDIATKKFVELVGQCTDAVNLAVQTVNDITFEDDDDDAPAAEGEVELGDADDADEDEDEDEDVDAEENI